MVSGTELTSRWTDHLSFEHIEYQEAANAYFKGVEIGFTTLKNYVTMNAIFFTILGLSSDSKSALIQDGSAFLRFVPIFALLVSLLMVSSFKYYNRHLENCRMRCQELEERNGGRLFTNLGSIAHDRNKFFSARLALIAITALFLGVWTLIVYLMNKSQLDNFAHSIIPLLF